MRYRAALQAQARAKRHMCKTFRFSWRLAFSPRSHSPRDPLPSWNDGAARQSIVKFVEGVTREGSPDFVPVPERIATFDNDGTLWAEQPLYAQLFFLVDRVKAMAPQHPEWKTQEPFATVLKGDPRGITAGGEAGVAALLTATHSGMTTDEFSRSVSDWIATAKHPKTGQPFTAMVYKPMLELLDYLRANGFKTFIVSGGGIEFMRPWAEKVYGIPPEQVIGSSGGLQFGMKDGRPVLIKLPNLVLKDDQEGKPSASSATSGAARSPPSATPTATCRCCNGPATRRACDYACSCTTRTARASGRMTGLRTSASSTRGSTRPAPAAGRSST